MNLELMLAQLRGTLSTDLIAPDRPLCSQRRCKRPVDVKKNGDFAKSCRRCLRRRAASCKRRRQFLTARGGCRRCAYRKRLAGDFLCQRCREERNVERAQKRQDARDAAVIDEFAAKPERLHRASNLDLGISPWNARRRPEASAAYWSPLPDPEPVEEREWAHSPFDDERRFRRC